MTMETGSTKFSEKEKRRLPNWMLGSAIDGSEKAKGRSMPRQVEEETVDSVEDDVILHTRKFDEAMLKKGTTKTRKRKLSKEPLQKCKLVNPSRKNRKPKREEENDVPNTPIDNDDEELDLTIEDLMSMAEEYVKAHEAEVQEVVDKASILESESKATTMSVNGLEDSCREMDSSNVGEGVEDVCVTSDSTRDMLDLFLGPLLKKPLQNKSKKTELDQGEMMFTDGMKKVDKKMVGEDIAPLVKKKSSFKDKVSMLLD